MSAATVLQSRSTSELESLAGAYALDSDSSKLTDFERSAILAGIQVELLERDTTRKDAFQFATERERLQAVIEDKEKRIFDLQCEVSLLEDLLEQERKANGKAKSVA
jgi:hypothetical protein